MVIKVETAGSDQWVIGAARVGTIKAGIAGLK